MKKFIRNIIFFFILALIVGELVVRFTHAMSDIPQRTINEEGIQKYLPNQEGYWKGGDHKWTINQLGWPGELPDSYQDLIIIIGDSYIENFMNPNDCHQSVFLKYYMPGYNFLETGRSGVSFIEALEISKHNDSLNPRQTLIYVNNNDFYESVVEVKPMNDITQFSLKTKSVVDGKMKAPGLKKILYNWKLLYYFYNRFPLYASIEDPKDEDDSDISEITTVNTYAKNEISELMNFVVDNYNIDDKTLVFNPNSNLFLIDICRQSGFKVIVLDSSNDKDWTFDYDSHWTCYGHQQVASQVSNTLLKTLNTTQ